jgi:hypothetical protein
MHLYRKQGIGPKHEASPEQLVKDLIGIYGTSPTCYLSLAARIQEFHTKELDDAFYLHHTIARMRSMRGSLFLIHKDDLPVIFQSTKHISISAFQRIVKKCGLSDAEYTRISDEIGDMLSTSCMTVAEIRKALRSRSQGVERSLNYLVALMCAEGILTRARVRGGWKSDLFEYTRFDNWFPGVDLDSISPVDARACLATLYFKSFGPATVQDFHWWSGLSKQEVAEAISSLKDTITKVSIEGSNLTYLMMESELDGLSMPAEKRVNTTALLPAWDGYIMGYKFRSHYLPEKWADFLYDKSGNSTSVVMIDGYAGGIWDMEIKGAELSFKIALFEKSGRNRWEEIKKHAERLGETFGFNRTSILKCELPAPLKSAAQNRFLSPLADAKGEPFS